MMSNKNEIKSINRIALITELINKTKTCAFAWVQLAPFQYKTEFSSYDLYLTKTGSDTYLLDVIKDASPYRSYNSTFQEEVTELYETVDAMAARLQEFARQKEAMIAVGRLPNRCRNTYNIDPTGGLSGGGNPDKYLLVPESVFLLPKTLTFADGMTFPWIGNVSDIDDEPNAVMHDDDDSFIRQEVAGAPPTSWGYAYVGFNDTELPPSGPFTIRTRVVHRRENQPGSNVTVAIVADSSIVFNDQEPSQATYTIFDSGDVSAPVDEIEELVVRINNFSNTGNATPIALRITAVDLAVDGFARFDDGTPVVRSEDNQGVLASGQPLMLFRYRPVITGKGFAGGDAIVEYEGTYITLGGSAFVETFTP